MANIKSIGGNPIVLGTGGIEDGSVTDAKLAQTGGVLETAYALVKSTFTRTMPESHIHTLTDATPVLAGMSVYGESTQDGTPTPSVPVPIQSVTPDGDGGVVLRATGRNVWGGSRMRADFLSAVSGANSGDDADGSYVSATASQLSGKRLFEGPFRQNTAYTLVLKVRKSASGRGLNISFLYTDGTLSDPLNLPSSADATVTGTYAWTSDPSKTLAAISGRNQGDSTYVYVDGSGLLEGAVTVGDLAPYAEALVPIDLQGHTLRSLPDGTRDEVTVGADGRVTLTQRVGEVTFTIDGATVAVAAASYYPNQYGIYTQQLTYSASRWAEMGASSIEAPSTYLIVQTSNYGASEYNAGAADTKRTGIAANKSAYRVYVRTTSPLTVEQLTEVVTETPIVALGRLATPVTHDLGHISPASLPAPELTAAIVPSAPSVLTVGRDPIAGFERLAANLATTETSPATANHAVGTLLVLDGRLCKVTTAIAIGETVTIGTNVQATTVAAELAALA